MDIFDANDRAQERYDDEVVALADGDQTVIINTSSEYAPDAYWTAVDCVLGELNTSTAITAQMESTTSLMGVQTAAIDTLTYQWSYHPDNGMNLTITHDAS